MNSTLFRIQSLPFLLVSMILLLGINTQSYSNSDVNNKTKDRYITINGHLFSEMSSGIETIVDENSNKITQPTGIIGEVSIGMGVKKVHKIRFSRMQVTLEDGRKGWVDIQLVSPSGEKDAYLMNRVKLSELMAQPQKGNTAVLISDENKNIQFKRNTPLKVMEWKHEEGKNKNSLFQSGTWWAKVEIEDYSGWIENSKFRFKGQMFDTAIPMIWYPIRWINRLLGDGFWAGLFIIILLGVPMLIGYAIARFISTKIRFLPNFILYFIIILVGFLIYSNTFMSIYDASAFNRAGGISMTFYGIIVLIVAVATFFYIRKIIFETRCPDCKHWDGSVLDSSKLSETNITKTVTWRYYNGTEEKEVTHTTIEHWEDFCNCSNCGFCWKIRRIEKSEYKQ